MDGASQSRPPIRIGLKVTRLLSRENETMNVRRCNIAILLLTVAGCGTTSHIIPLSQPQYTQTTTNSVGAPPYASYNQVVVLDFIDGTNKLKFKGDKRLEYDEVMKAVVRDFADRIASEIRRTGAYATVSREPVEGEALQISGVITSYAAGNAFQRFFGMGDGRSYIDATVDISRTADAAKLGYMIVDKISYYPLVIGPGDTAISAWQTIDRLMQSAAEEIAGRMAEGHIRAPMK